MPELILYLLKANVALALFYLAYHLVLRKLTFYHLNRLFLVFGIVFSAVYPLINLNELFSRHQELAAIQTYAVAIPVFTPTAIPEQSGVFNYWLIPVALFWIGSALMVVRLMMQFVSLYKIHRASEPANYKGVAFRKVNNISEAFSFWKTIYLNPSQHRTPELESILKHEQIHVRGWHTLDVLLAELSTVFYWFNPGVWLMKKAMKENLEFIADQHVVDAGVDKKEYQYLLLKVVGATQPQIANQFNFPSLKRRITMMNKMPTNKANRLRLLVVLPIVAVSLLSFRTATQSSEFIATSEHLVKQVSMQDGEKDLPKEIKEHLERNPAIKNVRVKLIDNRNSLVIHLRRGGTEVYYLDDVNSMAALENKYGKLPVLPPPPPPAPAAPDAEQIPPPPAPQNPSEPFIFILDEVEYYKNKAKWPKDYKDFIKRNSSVKKVGWKFTDKKGGNLESIVIYLKSGNTEVYDYNGNLIIPTAEAKYGTLPLLPPPPPPVVAKEQLPPPPPVPSSLSLYIPDESNRHDDHRDFLKRNLDVKDIGWKIGETKDRQITILVIYLKSGGNEEYNLDYSDQVERVEQKYGKIPNLPPPPPPVMIKKN